MATARARQYERTDVARAAALIVACTVGLTASFVGLVALLSGRSPGVSARLPLYVLGLAAAFVVAILALEDRNRDGWTVLHLATTLSIYGFIFAVLAGEGALYVARHPGELVASQLLFYFLAAGMIATGFGYWGVHHYEELPVAKGGAKSGFGR